MNQTEKQPPRRWVYQDLPAWTQVYHRNMKQPKNLRRLIHEIEKCENRYQAILRRGEGRL
jgi:hypothetical protein